MQRASVWMRKASVWMIRASVRVIRASVWMIRASEWMIRASVPMIRARSHCHRHQDASFVLGSNLMMDHDVIFDRPNSKVCVYLHVCLNGNGNVILMQRCDCLFQK